jgi:hypothetical protein
VIGGETLVLGVNALHSHKQSNEVQLCAFDVLELMATTCAACRSWCVRPNWDRLLRGRPDGIFTSPCEQARLDLACFCAACDMGLRA